MDRLFQRDVRGRGLPLLTKWQSSIAIGEWRLGIRVHRSEQLSRLRSCDVIAMAHSIVEDLQDFLISLGEGQFAEAHEWHPLERSTKGS